MTPQRTRAALLKIVREECDDAHEMAGRLENRLARAAAQLTAAHVWYRISQRVEQELGVTIPPRPIVVADRLEEDPPAQ